MSKLNKMESVEDAVINVETTEVQGTPFMLIERTENEKSEFFGVLGNHRLTEIYDNAYDALEDIKSITWDRIVAVLFILLQKYEKK